MASNNAFSVAVAAEPECVTLHSVTQACVLHALPHAHEPFHAFLDFVERHGLPFVAVVAGVASLRVLRQLRGHDHLILVDGLETRSATSNGGRADRQSVWKLDVGVESVRCEHGGMRAIEPLVVHWPVETADLVAPAGGWHAYVI